MKIAQLLAELEQQHIELWVEGDRLRYSAPKGVMTPALTAQLKSQREALMEAVRTRQQAPPPTNGASPIPPVSRTEPQSLSFTQLRLWFMQEFHPDNAAYNIPIGLQITGPLNCHALEQSLANIAGRHEILRLKIVLVHEQPMQTFAPDAPSDFHYVDLRDQPDAQTKAEQLAQQMSCQPFTLSRGPWLRTYLYQTAEQAYLLLLLTHHLVADGWSISLLLQELTTGYQAALANCPAELPVLPIQYVDYAAWQKAQVQGALLQRQLAYWQQKLAGALPVMELPTDFPRPAFQTFQGATYRQRLPHPLPEELTTLSRHYQVSLFMTLLAAFQVLLYRYSQQTDIIVATAISSRSRSEVEPLIGPFSNNLLLRSDLTAQPSFTAFLSQVRQTVVEAFANQELPFEYLVRELQPTRDLSRQPLFQVMFVLHHTASEEISLADLKLVGKPIETGTAKFDLTLSLAQTGEGLIANFEYNRALFEPATIERMAAHYETLLSSIVRAPTTSVRDLNFLTAAERKQLVDDQHDPEPTDGALACLHTWFEAQVTRTPLATALRAGEQTVTYQALNAQANRLAHHLQTLGVGPEVLVAICLDRSVEMIIALLGVLKAGGAYLPLDPTYPPERLSFMVADASVQVLLTTCQLRATLALNAKQIVELNQLDQLPGEWGNPTSAVLPANLAYVIYTSGSTGQPKGVMIEHQAACNLVKEQIQAFAVRADSHTLQFAPFGFDASVSEIFTTLLAGATLHLAVRTAILPGPALLAVLREQAITHVTLPPSVLAVLEPAPLPKLQTLIAAGEPCSAEIIGKWAKGRRFLNAYGPTEATVCTTIAECTASTTKPPIGLPLAGVQVYVVDSQGELLPIGAPGELYIGGAGVARGYLNRPALTAQCFLPSPYEVKPGRQGARLYRTGDYVRRLPTGALEFLGRRDHQVKIRGYRIELAEIEAALLRQPPVKQAVVSLYEASPGSPSLVAYLVAAKAAIDVDQLKQALQQRLPGYMVPKTVVLLTSLPRTAHGKIDRAALPAPATYQPAPQAAVEQTHSLLEQTLIQIWQEVLNVPVMTIDDNFFELGGDSLLAAKLMYQLRRRMGQAIPMSLIFQQGTVRALAKALSNGDGLLKWSPLVTIRATGSKPPFFCVHPIMGVVFPYYELARALGNDQPFYGLQAIGLEQGQRPLTSIRAIAQLYIEALQLVQSEGPYFLGGWSFGSTVAFEMAQQLHAQGQKVALLAIFDTPAPIAGQRVSAWHTFKFSARLLYGLSRQVSPYVSDYFRLLKQFAQRAHQPLTWQSRIIGAYFKEPGVAESPTAQAADLEWLLFRQLKPGPLAAVFFANLWAGLHYQPQPYPGRVTLFRGEPVATATADPTYGWAQLTNEPVAVYPVPGNHMTLLRPPNAASVAEQLSQCLAQASQR